MMGFRESRQETVARCRWTLSLKATGGGCCGLDHRHDAGLDGFGQVAPDGGGFGQFGRQTRSAWLRTGFWAKSGGIWEPSAASYPWRPAILHSDCKIAGPFSGTFRFALGCLVWHGRPGECGRWAVSLKVAEGGRCGLDHGQDASLVFLSQPVEPFQPRCRMRDQDRMRRSRAASAPTSIASRTVRGVRTAGPDRHQPGRCPVRPPSA